jgi:NAD(P)-dependent dehydrogenase (short-subunit alcohol dehydrogenase family)
MQMSLFDLSKRVAIVTGSARGLGRTLAEGLAEHGARVVVCALNTEAATDTADRIRATGGEAVSTYVDVADAESCESLVRFAVETYGRASTCW